MLRKQTQNTPRAHRTTASRKPANRKSKSINSTTCSNWKLLCSSSLLAVARRWRRLDSECKRMRFAFMCWESSKWLRNVWEWNTMFWKCLHNFCTPIWKMIEWYALEVTKTVYVDDLWMNSSIHGKIFENTNQSDQSSLLGGNKISTKDSQTICFIRNLLFNGLYYFGLL